MSSHSGTIGRKRDYYFGGEQIRRQRSAEWHSRHGYSSSEEEYQNNPQNSIGAFDTQLLASLLIQSQQLANIDRSYRSDCDNEEVTESLLTEYPQTYQNSATIGSPHTTIKSSRNPFSLKYEIHPPTEPDRLSFNGSVAGFDRLQCAEISGSSSSYLQANSSVSSHNPGGSGSTVRVSRSKNNRLNRVSGMTSSSSATSSNSNPASRSERERQKLHQQQQQLLQKEFKDISNAAAAAVAAAEGFSDIDKTIFEPPPDPAPPEIPPRTQSLLLSMRKRSDYQLKFEENGDQKHEEFIPQSQQKDYLMAENSRSSEFPPKSITSSDSQSQQGSKLIVELTEIIKHGLAHLAYKQGTKNYPKWPPQRKVFHSARSSKNQI